jgi:hypothetical protein
MLDATHAPNFRAGDYWLVPARTADIGAVLWPPKIDAMGQPVKDTDGSPEFGPMPPNGVRHYYAPLAVVVDPADKVDYSFLGSDPAATVIDRRWKINLAIQAPKFPT